MKRILSALVLAGVVSTGCGGAETDPESESSGLPNDRSPLGTNLYVESWTSEFPWKDIFKQSRSWYIAATVQDAPLTADGWPATSEPVETVMYEGVQGHYPKGRYVCLYTGQGTVEIYGGAVIVQPTQPGRIEFDALTDQPIYLRLSNQSPENPVRNIRVIMPGFESNYLEQPFHPAFLERLRRYKVLRFMDWQITGHENVHAFEQRPKKNDCNQMGRRGVALEYMIQLANLLHADAWFCMPHWADDAYVTQFAQMVKKDLNAGLKVYLEYSNEVWNNGAYFPQHGYANTQGLTLNLAPEVSDPATKAYLAGRRFYAQRAVEMFKIWTKELGSDRLVRVLAAQTDGPDVGLVVMDHVVDGKKAAEHADVLAIGCYFGIEVTTAQSLNDVWAAFPSLLQQTEAYVKENVTNAKLRGLPVIAYEGGQHLVAGSPGALADLFSEANRHPMMKKFYQDLLSAWKSAGGRLFVHELSGMQNDHHGCWGALEWFDQTHSPKHDALMEFIDANPRWW